MFGPFLIAEVAKNQERDKVNEGLDSELPFVIFRGLTPKVTGAGARKGGGHNQGP